MFFFGQETKYRPRKEDGEVKYQADYFQRSAYFPQQTTLLGALRYLLLQINGQIPIKDEDKAKKLIGPESFSLTQNGEEKKYGKIKTIGPVFLMMENKNNDQKMFYMPAPKDINTENKRHLQFEFSSSESFPVIHQYDEKDGLAHLLVDLADFNCLLPYEREEDQTMEDYFFVPVEKVGIDKYKTDDAFYKQILFKFNPEKDIYFVFEAELDEDAGIKPGIKYYVPTGAEKQLFIWEFTENEEIPPITYQIARNGKALPAVLLTSDAYIPADISDMVHFAVSDNKPFRFLSSKVEKNRKYGKFNFPKKYQLYERGSIFFFKNDDNRKKFINLLSSQSEFTQIGYNQFINL